jgi:hypothetical protein
MNDGNSRIEEVLLGASASLSVRDKALFSTCVGKYGTRPMLENALLVETASGEGVMNWAQGERGGMPAEDQVPTNDIEGRADPCQSSVEPEKELEQFSEAEEDNELVQNLFDEIDIDKSGTISSNELKAALSKHNLQAELKVLLESLLAFGGDTVGQDITRNTFSKAFEKLPRVRGEVVSWARNLRLEEHLAKLISKSRTGDLFDGLKGLKDPALKDSDVEPFVQTLSKQFADVMQRVLRSGLQQLRASGAATARSHVNTKFALDGAYVGQFATLNDFYSGPEALIGSPNPKVKEGLETEHCRRKNADTPFTTPNYNLTTTPKQEWEFVVCPQVDYRYPHTPKNKTYWDPDLGWKGEEGRDVIKLDTFMNMDQVKKADLKETEVIGLRLYTGPTYILYNARLRGFPAKEVALLEGNDYETTIFIIASGITKLSKVTGIPSDRKLYRGLSGMILPRQFWEEFDECQVSVVISAPSKAGAVEIVRKIKAATSAATSTSATTTTATAVESNVKTSAFELGINYLHLIDMKDEAAALVTGKQIRMVKGPYVAGGGESVNTVRMTVAFPISKFEFDSMRKEFEAALIAACGGGVALKVEEIANKPCDFKGGGAPPTPQ